MHIHIHIIAYKNACVQFSERYKMKFNKNIKNKEKKFVLQAYPKDKPLYYMYIIQNKIKLQTYNVLNSLRRKNSKGKNYLKVVFKVV